MLADSRCPRAEAHGEQLLPGIPDEITLDRITPKLPWRSLHTLSSLSQTWLHASRNHRVFNARVRSHSTETLVLVNYLRPRKIQPSGYFNPGNDQVIGLYSTRDGSVYELPPIAYIDRGIPTFCQCVSLNGKVYGLGGWTVSGITKLAFSSTVYVLDLAGQRGWEECGSMKRGRIEFGCGVIDGKIYVFGGTFPRFCSCECEVYDPEENDWSPIASMTCSRRGHRVETVGEELLVHGGSARHPDSGDFQSPNCLDFYHPVRDEWRRVEPFGRDQETTFLANGKFYSMSWHGRRGAIHVHVPENNSWTHLHSFSLTTIGLSIGDIGLSVQTFERLAILPVKGELVARMEVYGKACLTQCEGLGGKEKKIVWERKAEFPLLNSLPVLFPVMYPIQL